MRKLFVSFLICLWASIGLCGQTKRITDDVQSAPRVIEFKMLPGERWWGGIDHFKRDMDGNKFTLPLDSGSRVYLDMRQNYTNHAVPFFLSSCGRYVWSDEPFEIWFENGAIKVSGAQDLALVEAGTSLREAFLHASAGHFPPSGRIPEEIFLSNPQYNTFIELTNPTQAGVLKYAHDIVANGFPSDAVLMIDAGWAKYHGNFSPDKDKFPDMKSMCDLLHAMGFKVMLWVVPFVSPDTKEFLVLEKKGYLVMRKDVDEPYISKWWGGYSAVVDMTNPDAKAFYINALKDVQERYGVDGFKFDAGDYYSYKQTEVRVFDDVSYDSRHGEKWAELSRDFPFHEFRACWKMAGQPVVQRLQDKDYSWDGVGLLLPSMLASAMEGHQFVCPDMIGGGQFATFIGIDEDKFDQELIVRSCQIHAMMPMMQFSVAPWRILNKENLEICRRAACMHREMAPYLLGQAHKCAESGEPILRPMDYAFPGEGFEGCLDQYMLGEELLVAPMVTPGTSREVRLPAGRWVDEYGKIYKGGRTYTIDVPLDRIPRFTKK